MLTLLAGLALASPQEDPRHLWHADHDRPVERLAPVSGGRLVVKAGQKDGPPLHQLLDGRTGEVLWRLEGTASIVELPSGLVVVADGKDSALTGLGPRGATRWHRPLDERVWAWTWDAAADRLWAVTVPPDADGAAPASMVAWEGATGEERVRASLGSLQLDAWDTGADLHPTSDGLLAVLEGQAFHVGADGVVSGPAPLDGTDGDIVGWTNTPLGTAVHRGGHLWLLEADGAPRWHWEAVARVDTVVAVDGDVLVAARGSAKQHLVFARLDAGTGEARWTVEHKEKVHKKKARPAGGVAVLGDVFLAQVEEAMVAYDLDTGAVAWSRELDKQEARYARKVFAHGGHAVLVGGNHLSAWEADGTQRWHLGDLWQPFDYIASLNKAFGPESAALSQASATLSAGTVQYVQTLADMQWAGSGSSTDPGSYVFTPEQRAILHEQAATLQLTQATVGMGMAMQSAAAAVVAAGQHRVRASHLQRRDPRFLIQVTTDLKGFQVVRDADVWLVDLDTGEAETFDLPEVTPACAPAQAIDVDAGLVYVGRHWLNIQCGKQPRSLDALELR